MRSSPDLSLIEWRMHLRSAPDRVFSFLTTDEGRACFWARTETRSETEIHFQFPNGQIATVEQLSIERPRRLELNYMGSIVTFSLAPDGAGGTDLTMSAVDTPVDDRLEVFAGWVSVLLALKAAVDHGIDIRNGDPNRTWDEGYVDQ